MVSLITPVIYSQLSTVRKVLAAETICYCKIIYRYSPSGGIYRKAKSNFNSFSLFFNLKKLNLYVG